MSNLMHYSHLLTLKLDFCSIFLCAILKLIILHSGLTFSSHFVFYPCFCVPFSPFNGPSASTFPFILYNALLCCTLSYLIVLLGASKLFTAHSALVELCNLLLSAMTLFLVDYCIQTTFNNPNRCTVADNRACGGVMAVTNKPSNTLTIKSLKNWTMAACFFFFSSHWFLHQMGLCICHIQDRSLQKE